ncbi:annexin D5 isoform X1 [Brassica rapa]|uniref:annexin D5 isoform X1 n=1 Tax=Brassica campestris TaxID=3711 RepID=UPI00142D793A|nr:annexin D5 isoform X1 [Brassica rapa]
MATMKIPMTVPSPRVDAEQLFKAFKGRGCDASVIINILAHRNAMQRALIEQEYETKFSDDLRKRLQSELHGHLKKALLLWMPEAVERDASILKQALRGAVTDHKAVAEIICTRSGSQLRQIKQVYLNTFGVRVEQDVESEASGNHKRVLLAYLNTTRYEGPEIDDKIVENDARVLKKAVARKHKSDDQTLIQIFTDRSRTHLVALRSTYRSMFGKELGKAIRDETRGNFEHVLLTILQCAENSSFYFAKVNLISCFLNYKKQFFLEVRSSMTNETLQALRKSVKGLGTDDTALIRMVVTRAEVDMHYIVSEYRKRYKKTLYNAVQSDTSGHYKTFLLSLLGPNV